MSLISNKTREANRVFPLFRNEDGDALITGEATANVSTDVVRSIRELVGSTYATDEEIAQEFLFYTYSILHSPTYRSRYAEFLALDFPRLPLPQSSELFHELSRPGGELVSLHLMQSPKLNDFITTYTGPKNPGVGRVGWSDNTVWLDAAATKKSQPASHGTIGFQGVPEAVWNFHVGGYQVCRKWLKDRKGRTLSAEDIAHYQKIVVALAETIRLMQDIDGVIEKHGGWPGAFVTSASEAEV